MDDIELLHAARPRPAAPSPAAYTAARAALLQHAAIPPSRGRDRRFSPSRTRIQLAAAAVLATGAAAIAVVIAAPSGPPAVTPGTPPSAVQKSGRQILLAAATVAAATPEESGTYWYVKTAYTKTTPRGDTGKASVETWTRHDGQSWVRLDEEGKVTDNDDNASHWSDGFDLEGTRLSYEQIQRLPTDPDELVTWLVAHAGEPLNKETARIVPLIDVLSTMPAPPKVRAAAFRALASLPNVRSLGTVDGGESLSIDREDGELRLIVDPEAARLRESAFTGTGKAGGTSVVEAAEWTDDLPEAVR
ncbi:CU044_5270 family protein [Acrocarpospora sp. B8E8]|uniref:CU044_5270 family protein n=1 Tax=Acrocarpospora sp. B8E8 TaxID=3153572 RepID=UPI00325F5398